jgi:hypothetical protein
MGQVLFEPPNVAGWPGGAAWLNSATIFARLNFLNAITGGAELTPGAGQQQRPNIQARRQQAATATPVTTRGLGTANDALSHYLPFVVDDALPDDARNALLDYSGGGNAELSAAQLRGLVYLVLGSPQFHLS